jgi:hypothetical protein
VTTSSLTSTAAIDSRTGRAAAIRKKIGWLDAKCKSIALEMIDLAEKTLPRHLRV